MRVGISASTLGTQGGGIETYVRNLVRALGAIDPEGDYTLFFDRPLPADALPATASHMRRVVVQPRRGRLHIPFAASLALARERIDVVHVQLAGPLLFPSRIVVTLHDLAFERYPQFFPAPIVRRLRLAVPLTLRRAAIVLTDSAFCRGEIVRRYRLPPERVVVAPLATDPVFRPLSDPADLARVRDRYGLAEPYILYVGDAMQLRKNVVTLVDAYTRARQSGAITHRLVLTGPREWLEHDVFAPARRAGLAGAMVFTGRLSDHELAAVYNAADLLVYPSLYEGFGLPPLEAMACGTAVITSNAPSLPEVVGDAALTVNPHDTEALARAMVTVLTDSALRARLAEQGPQRAAAFSWDATARIVRDAYRRATGA